MKKFLLAVLLTASVSGLAFAQEDAKVNRSLSFYLDSFTGQLNHNPDNGQLAFADNEFEFGMTYSQNFATAQWLSIWVKALIVTGTGAEYTVFAEDSEGKPTSQGNYLGNSGYFIQGYGQPRAQVGLNFGGWAILAMDTRGLLATEVYYTLRFGAGGNLTFQGILEMWAVPQYSLVPTGFDDDNNPTGLDDGHTVVDLFELRINYEVAMAQGWTFRSKLGFRFGAGGWAGGQYAGNPVDASAANFGQSFHIRWENQVVWSITPSFYVWTQLRYQIRNIAFDNKFDAYSGEVKHDVYLQAGLGYSLDLSGL